MHNRQVAGLNLIVLFRHSCGIFNGFKWNLMLRDQYSNSWREFNPFNFDVNAISIQKSGSHLRCKFTCSQAGFGGVNFHLYCWVLTTVTGAYTQLKSMPTCCLKTVITQETDMVQLSLRTPWKQMRKMRYRYIHSLQEPSKRNRCTT
jgi:hypothetical protein